MKPFKIIALALFLLCCSWNVWSQKNILRIGLIADNNPEQENEFVDLIKEEITKVLQTDVQVRFDPAHTLYSGWDVKKAKSHFQQLLNNDEVDVIVGIGVLSSDPMANGGPYDKPVIASVIVDPTMQNIPITPEGTSGVQNLNYVLSPYSVVRDLEKFRTIYPFKKIAVVIQQNLLLGIEGLYDHFDEYFVREEWAAQLLTIGGFGAEGINKIEPDVDAIYIGPIFSLPAEEIQDIIHTINERKLPSFAMAGRLHCEMGALAGMAPSSNLRRISRRIAVNIQKILDGTDPGELPVGLRYTEELTINMATVRQIDYYPTWDVLSEAVLLNEDDEDIEKKWSLLEAIQHALEQNLDIMIESKAVASGRLDIRDAKSALLPQADVYVSGRMIDKDRASSSFGSNPEWGTSIGAEVSQVVLSEPARANVRIQEYLQEARSYALDAVLMDVISDVAVAYLDVLRAKTLRTIQRENLSLNRKNLELAKVRNEVGYSGPSDLYRWESSIAQAKKELNNAEAGFRIAKIQLNQILNRPVNELFITQEISLADNYIITNDDRLFRYIDNPAVFAKFADFMVQEGFRNLPEIRQIEAAIAAQERLQVMRQRELFTPTVAVQANAENLFWKEGAGSSIDAAPFPGATSIDNSVWSIGVRASLPIFTGFRRQNALEKAIIEKDKIQLERHRLVRQLEQRIRNSMEETAASYTNIDLNFQSRDAGRKNLSLVQEAYSKGLVSVIQLIDAQNAAIQAEEGAANAVFEFVIDLIKLERAIGNFYSISSNEQRDLYFQRIEEFIGGK